MDLSNEIKAIRHNAFMTQETFAKELGVAFSTVNRWEMGKTQPNMSTMKKINDFCNKNDISFEGLREVWINKSQLKE